MGEMGTCVPFSVSPCLGFPLYPSVSVRLSVRVSLSATEPSCSPCCRRYLAALRDWGASLEPETALWDRVRLTGPIKGFLCQKNATGTSFLLQLCSLHIPRQF